MSNKIQMYLDALPSNITKIDISYMKMERGGVIDLSRFTRLIILLCVDCDISYLPSLPPTLLYIDCYSNEMEYLPQLPCHLEYLRCGYNNLKSLPKLPDTLEILACNRNRITELPSLPFYLEHLYCGYNELINLRKLPDGLTHLECSRNYIQTLPILPKGLIYLECDQNYIRHIPFIPYTLQTLECSNNLLYILPILHDKLDDIQYNNNPICDAIWQYSSMTIIKREVNTLHNFRYLYNILKLRNSSIFKTKFRKWLWEYIRNPKLKLLYCPGNIFRIINEIQQDTGCGDIVTFEMLEKIREDIDKIN
jgi:hypothetical protein